MFFPAADTIAFSEGGVEAARFDSGGTLVVGTTASPTAGVVARPPLYLKQFNSSSAFSGVHIEASADDSILGIGYNGSTFQIGTTYRSTGAYRDISFSTSGAERMRITSGGDVGIGTTSPAVPLDVSKAGSNDKAVFRNATRTLYFNLDSAGGGIFTGAAQTGNYVYFDANGNSVQIATNGTERMRLNNSGTVILQGGSGTASGVGITFPATQSASSDANTLDDYEEGTWTPTDGSGAGLTFSDVTARYTKVGRLVTVSVQLSYPITANGNNAQINGLPFAATVDSGLAIGYDHTAQVRNAYVTGSTIRPYATGSTRNTNANLTQSIFLTLAGSYIVA
jgi:hypothetical protein